MKKYFFIGALVLAVLMWLSYGHGASSRALSKDNLEGARKILEVCGFKITPYDGFISADEETGDSVGVVRGYDQSGKWWIFAIITQKWQVVRVEGQEIPPPLGCRKGPPC